MGQALSPADRFFYSFLGFARGGDLTTGGGADPDASRPAAAALAPPAAISDLVIPQKRSRIRRAPGNSRRIWPHPSSRISARKCCKIESPAVFRRPRQGAPDCPPRNDRALPGLGQPVDEGREQVLLHREPAVGSLDPVTPAHARRLAGETLLAFGAAHVLDGGVAEYHVEGPVAERQPAAVPRHPQFRALASRPRRAACSAGPRAAAPAAGASTRECRRYRAPGRHW